MTGEPVYPLFELTDGGKREETCDISACRKYTVCWIGMADGWRYEAYFGKEMIAYRPQTGACHTEAGWKARRSLYRECAKHARRNQVTDPNSRSVA